MSFQTELQVREQWAAMQALPEDLTAFALETETKQDKSDYLAKVFNVSPNRRPSWWTGDLLPMILSSLGAIVLEGKKAAEAFVPTPKEVFTVTLLRNGSVVTSFEYGNAVEAVSWATAVYNQNTGVNTNKFLDNHMPPEADWWSITASHTPTRVAVQLTKNAAPVKV